MSYCFKGLVTTGIWLLVTSLPVSKVFSMFKKAYKASHSLDKVRCLGKYYRALKKVARVAQLCRKSTAHYLVCAIPGPLALTEQIHLTQVQENFNQEVQPDFIFAAISNTKCCNLSVIQTWNVKSGSTSGSRTFGVIMGQSWETVTVLKHGVQRNFSPDNKFVKAHVIRFPNLYNSIEEGHCWPMHCYLYCEEKAQEGHR